MIDGSAPGITTTAFPFCLEETTQNRWMKNVWLTRRTPTPTSGRSSSRGNSEDEMTIDHGGDAKDPHLPDGSTIDRQSPRSNQSIRRNATRRPEAPYIGTSMIGQETNSARRFASTACLWMTSLLITT